jgi:hypothetical protein
LQGGEESPARCVRKHFSFSLEALTLDEQKDVLEMDLWVLTHSRTHGGKNIAHVKLQQAKMFKFWPAEAAPEQRMFAFVVEEAFQ